MRYPRTAVLRPGTPLLFLLLFVTSVAACGEETPSFRGGPFEITITDVTDPCLDAALADLIAPPATLPSPVNMPAYSQLPAPVDLDFHDPFEDVEGVQLEEDGAGGMRTAPGGFANSGVELYPREPEKSCLVDFTVAVSVDLLEADSLGGGALLTVTRTQGEDCPATFGPEPAGSCQEPVVIRYSGARFVPPAEPPGQ